MSKSFHLPDHILHRKQLSELLRICLNVIHHALEHLSLLWSKEISGVEALQRDDDSFLRRELVPKSRQVFILRPVRSWYIYIIWSMPLRYVTCLWSTIPRWRLHTSRVSLSLRDSRLQRFELRLQLANVHLALFHFCLDMTRIKRYVKIVRAEFI